MFAVPLGAYAVGVGPHNLNANSLSKATDDSVLLKEAVPQGHPDRDNGDHCTNKWALDDNGQLQRITRKPFNPETALPCKMGPFVFDTLRRWDEGLGGSFQKRLPQIVYAEALRATYLDVQNGQVNADAGYDGKKAYDVDMNENRTQPAVQNRSHLPTRIWDKHHEDDYSRFLGMGPTSDCDYCSLDFWTNSANPTHLKAVDYLSDLYGGAAEKYVYQPLIKDNLEAICQAMDRGTELPVAGDPTLAAFSGPDREQLVLRVKGQSLSTTYFTPCAVNAHFVGRFHAARRERSLVPNRPEGELWFAVHLRWGDVGAGDPNEMADDKGRFAIKAANLGLLTRNALKVLDLLRERSKRKLVLHFFSEIDADGVKSFTDTTPNTVLHVDTPVTETLDLWSQCEVSLGRSTSGFFALAAFLSPKGIVLDANGIPLMKSQTHPLLAFEDSFSEEAFREVATQVLDSEPAVLGSSFSGWAFYSHECPASQRNAAASECLDAVLKAAQHAGVEMRGRIKNVDDGADTAVPPGCSYSRVSKNAIFNRSPAGRGGEWYQRVCTAEANALSPLQPTNAAVPGIDSLPAKQR